jgi:hypothetical protein
MTIVICNDELNTVCSMVSLDDGDCKSMQLESNALFVPGLHLREKLEVEKNAKSN